MYTVDWCRSFDGFSKDEEIDLLSYCLFFEEHLADRFFLYSTEHKAYPSFTIEVRSNQIPHLMGLQYWSNLETKFASKQYEKIRSGEWDLTTLSQLDPQAYRDNRSRIHFLPFLYQLLHEGKCDVKVINRNVRSTIANRRIDMVFRREHSKLVFLLELRKKTNEDDLYIPASITVHRPNSAALRASYVPLNIVKIESNIDGGITS